MRSSGWRCRLANRSAMSSARIVYRPREDASAEAELSALVNVYMFVLNSKPAGMTNTHSTSVRYTEGVNDVERQPD